MNETFSPWGLDLLTENDLWILEILIGLLLLVLANFILKKAISIFRRKSLSALPSWKEKCDEIAHAPCCLILWLVGIAYVIDIVAERFGFSFAFDKLYPVRNAGVVLAFSWLILRWIKEVQSSLFTHRSKTIDPATIQIVGRLATIALAIVSGILVLQILGINTLPLVAFGSIGAAAIGFAGKDILANLFGGLMIHVTRSFTVGDQVLLLDRQLEGTIEEIGWYITSLRDKEKRPIYLPNAVFSTMFLVNISRMSHRRLEFKIALSFQDFNKLEMITKELHRKIAEHSLIDCNLPIHVFFNAINEGSFTIYIDSYTLATRLDDFLRVKEEVLRAIHETIQENEATLSSPSLHITMPLS